MADPNHKIWEEIRLNIEKHLPDMVGITMYIGKYKSAKNIVVINKRVSKDIKVIVGGAASDIGC
jgi:hypothetical protein